MDKPRSGKFGGTFRLINFLMGGTTGWLFTLLFSLVGGLTIGFAGYELSSLRASLQWPRVGGEIITSEVAEHVTVSRDDRGRESSRKVTFSSNVVYRFEVKGKEYTGERVAFYVELDRAEAEQTVAKYPLGKYVRVYYAPENPSNAVLIPGGDEYFYRTAIKIGYFALVIGWVSFPIVIGLMVLVGFIRNFPKSYAARKDYYDEKILFFLRKIASRKAMEAIVQLIDTRRERLGRKRKLEGHRTSGGHRKKSIWDGFSLKTALGWALMIPLVGLALMMWMPFGFHFLSLGIDGVLSPDGEKFWPTANALVIKSEMKRVRVTTSDRTASTALRYDLTVVVEYSVLGKNYTLNKRNFGGFADEKAARKALNDFPKGNYVEVYFNPSDPEAAFLYPMARPGILMILFGLFMVAPPIVGGFVFLWVMYRKLRRRFREETPPEPA